jgi:glycine oxidase
MNNVPDIAIVGGGIIGLTTGYFLAREGRRVIVIDKGDFGQEASWAGAGIVISCDLAKARSPIDVLRAHSVRMFPALAQELRERTGIDNGYRRSGGLEFPDLAEAGHAEEWHGEEGAVGPLSARELAQLEPMLGHDLSRVWHLPDMAQVRNPRHLRALQAACQALGVQMRPQCAVRALDRDGQRVTALETSDGKIVAIAFLLTAGAWTDELLGGLGWRPGIRPVRGQMVLLNAPANTLQRILLCGPRYVVPRGDGHILVGSTEEDAGFEKRNTAVAVRELIGLAVRLVPELNKATLKRCWSGLRPGSPDGMPFLGRVPGWDNVYVAAGHFRGGIQLSPGTGLVMKQLLLGEPLTVPLEAFRVDR